VTERGKAVSSARYLLGAVRTVLVEYYTWLLFVGIYLVLGIFVPTIFRSAILLNVLVQGTTVCLLSIGMTFAMLVGEIDLSMVAVAAFSPMAGILLWERGFPVPAAILLTLLMGCGIGLCNGVIVTRLKIPSLVQTVAMWWMLEGVVLIVTRGVAKAGLPDLWMVLGRVFIGPIPLLVFFFLVVVALAIVFARRTVTGRRLYMVGGNRQASSAMGIPVNRIRTIAFMISGLFAALAGYVSSSRMGFVSASFAVEWLMPAIAAPVIAGVSLTGGRGNFFNVIAGAYLVQLIVMVVRAGGVSGYFTEFVQGVLVFVAILINTGRQRVFGR
jgi:simple sugar transport system permease protein/ribose transport system permease protein